MKKLLGIVVLVSMCSHAQLAYYVQRSGPIAAGEVAPDFTLSDQSGRKVTLSDARGKSPVVLVFYRGYW
jgi:cytochrome oxidase Cu insertion factor (SCO1/SenC/PrrC family)